MSFPLNAQYALQHVKNAHAYQTLDRPSARDQFIFRQIFEFQDFESFKQDAFYDDFNRYRLWKMSQVRYETEFGIVHVPAKDQVLDFRKIEDDEYQAKRIITKILKERRAGRKAFVPDEFKKDFLSSTQNNQEVAEFQKRLSMGGDDRQLTTQGGPQSDLGPVERGNPHQQLQESMNNEKFKLMKKK